LLTPLSSWAAKSKEGPGFPGPILTFDYLAFPDHAEVEVPAVYVPRGIGLFFPTADVTGISKNDIRLVISILAP